MVEQRTVASKPKVTTMVYSSGLHKVSLLCFDVELLKFGEH